MRRVLTESDGPFARISGRSIFPWDVDVAVDALAQCWESDPASVEKLLRGNRTTLLSRCVDWVLISGRALR